MLQVLRQFLQMFGFSSLNFLFMLRSVERAFGEGDFPVEKEQVCLKGKIKSIIVCKSGDEKFKELILR